jgi:Skp family chaperone for outer membrane proteins
MKKLFLLGCLAVALGLPARADLKVAMIDSSQAFDAFYKTKDMATRIAARKATLEKELQDFQAEYDNARQEAQSLATAVKDTSNPPEVRQSKDQALVQKVQELQAMEKELDQMRKARSQEIKDDLIRSHQEIAEQIMKVVTTYVTAQGYDLVLDKAAVTSDSGSFIVLSTARIVDVTPEIITRLNASAPAK